MDGKATLSPCQRGTYIPLQYLVNNFLFESSKLCDRGFLRSRKQDKSRYTVE